MPHPLSLTRLPWPDRLLARIEPLSNGCWEWRGSRSGRRQDRLGYGRVRGPEGVPVTAHRAAYEFFVGPIPPGLTLDHIACDYTLCVNPTHMVPATNRENGLRGNTIGAINARKTHCPRGHPYDEENTRRTRTGGRLCRQCERVWHERWVAKDPERVRALNRAKTARWEARQRGRRLV